MGRDRDRGSQRLGRPEGRFSEMMIKKLGLRILGSPFPGWMTSYMGFNLAPDISRMDALLALGEFAFGDLRCSHIEIRDRSAMPGTFIGQGIGTET